MINTLIIVASSIVLICVFIYSDYINRKNKKEVKKSHWNYRVGTRIRITSIREHREFLIFSCYYTNGIADSYGISDIGYFEDLYDAKKSFSKIQKALDKPIIDLDNFPNIYTPEINTEC